MTAVERASDRAAFLRTADFAVPGSYAAAAGGDPVAVDGILDAGFLEAAERAGTGVATAEAAFTCRAADLPEAAAPGDVLTVDGEAFDILEIRPDGTGMAVVMLERAGT